MESIHYFLFVALILVRIGPLVTYWKSSVGTVASYLLDCREVGSDSLATGPELQ
jgi:hypothetical protein